MASIPGGICRNGEISISFGNHEVKEKQKADRFEFKGDIYKLKTHGLVTRLEKNGSLLLETIPGSTVREFVCRPEIVTFCAEGLGDTQITLGLAPEARYKVTVDGVVIGSTKAGSTGKFIFSAPLDNAGTKISLELQQA